jgi:hypothetical protein
VRRDQARLGARQLNYFISDAVFEYIVAAVDLVAEQGWKLTPLYRFDTASGRWHHRDGAVEPPLRLDDLTYGPDGVLHYPQHHDRAPESALQDYLEQARELLEALPDDPGEAAVTGLTEDFLSLQWFELPAASLMRPSTS